MIESILIIFGGLMLFLYGMKVMSDGIQKLAGEKLHAILNYMTINRFTAIFTGFTITCLVQSSSATTVFIVSFVNAGLLSLVQAIGVIMGANIGTTLTAWIVSVIGFKIKLTLLHIVLPCIGIGFLFLFAKKRKIKDFGEVVLGFGLLFLGLYFLKEAVPNLDANAEYMECLRDFTGYGIWSTLFFIGVGTVLTIMLQSSSAAMAITITLAFNGFIDFPIAAAIVLGENIGTTITANLASINTNVIAKRAARAHFLFNIIGVIWMVAVFNFFIDFIKFFISSGTNITEDIPYQLSLFHTLFNIINTFILVWFIPQLAKVVEWLVKPKDMDMKRGYTLNYFKSPIQDTPELNILQAKREIHKMAGITKKMFDIFLEVFNNPNKKLGGLVVEVKELEELTDDMQEGISHYLANCSKENLNEASAENVTSLIRITNELESIGDGCFNLMILAQRRYDKKLVLSKVAVSELKDYSEQVKDFIDFNEEHLNEHLSAFDLERAFKLEESIDKSRNKLRKNSQKRMQKGSDIKSELLFLDMVKHFERIGDHSLNISQALRQMR